VNAGGSKDWPTTGAIATFLPISIAAPSASLPVVTFTNTGMLCVLCGQPWPHIDPRARTDSTINPCLGAQHVTGCQMTP
jgi:hypothetical protein